MFNFFSIFSFVPRYLISCSSTWIFLWKKTILISWYYFGFCWVLSSESDTYYCNKF